MYPFVFKLSGKKLLFVGGGNVASRKILSVLKVSPYAKITVISPRINDNLLVLYKKRVIEWKKEQFDFKNDYEGFDFAFVCTHDNKLNEKIAKLIKKYEIPVNVCDNKEISDFFMPAVIEYDDSLIAISSKGKSVKRAVEIKNRLEKMLKNTELS